MKFVINWIKTTSGNGIAQGDKMKIYGKGASHISGAIYQKGFPILPIFGMGENASVLVDRKNKSIKGLAVLKLRAFDKSNRGYRLDDAFLII